MRQIYFATTNPGKFHSAEVAFAEFDIEVIQAGIDVIEIQADSVEEVVKQKVKDAYGQVKKPIIALDAGFSLNVGKKGFPGPFVKYFIDNFTIEELLVFLKGFADRTCFFSESLAYYNGQEEPVIFSHLVPGSLSTEPKGELGDHLWSKLGLIFIPEGETKTHAQMTKDELAAWREKSYSGENNCWYQFAKWYSKQ